MPALKTFKVAISRSATEIAELDVLATSDKSAESKISNFLNRSERFSLDDLKTIKGVTIVDVDMIADEESSWEVT